MRRGALRRDNQQSTFAHIHSSSSHSPTSPWSPITYLDYVTTGSTLFYLHGGGAADGGGAGGSAGG